MSTAFPGAVQYPVRWHNARPFKPTVLLVVHITGNSALPNALAEAKYSNRDGSDASFGFVTNRDGSIVQCMDPETQVSWTTGSLNAPNLALPTVKAMVGSSYGPNFFAFAQCENVGYEPGNPLTAAQVATLSRLAAWASNLSGLPVNRNTVLGHRDFNSVDRHGCPTSGDLEALLAKVIAGANAILHPQEEAMTTITRTPFDPPRRVTINGPRTVQSYDALTLAKAKAVAIGPAGSSTTCDAFATIAPAPAWAPGGTVLHIAGGPLAGYIAHWRNSGTLLKDAPPPPAADCAAAVKTATDPLIAKIALAKTSAIEAERAALATKNALG